MVNVLDIFYTAVRVLGLSVLLAVWSYARYTAQVNSMRVRDKLNELKYALALNGGLFLFLSGMALTENRWLARIIWILLVIAVVVESVMRILRRKRGNTESHEHV